MRILCAAVTGPGHAYPVIAVARALAARGHEVILALEERFAPIARREGIGFVPLPSIEPADPQAFRPYDVALSIAQAFLSDVDRIAPDVALTDLITLGIALACEARGVPHATISPHPLPYPSRDLPPFGAARAPGRTRLGKRIDAKARARTLIDLQRGQRECNEARAALGLDPIDRLDVAWSQKLILVATPPALEPPRSDWPAHARVVGPCLYEPPGEAPPIPRGDGPLVVIAASTAHTGVVAAEATVAAERLGARAVVTAGAGPSPPVADPSRIVVVADAPHDALIAQADAVVCNGGGGIVARSLAAGVPLVILPGPGDQKENGWRVAATGAGLVARKPKDLARVLGRVLREPSFRTAAAHIAQDGRTTDGPAVAAALVEDLGASLRTG